jgi:hypothetical protein
VCSSDLPKTPKPLNQKVYNFLKISNKMKGSHFATAKNSPPGKTEKTKFF